MIFIEIDGILLNVALIKWIIPPKLSHPAEIHHNCGILADPVSITKKQYAELITELRILRVGKTIPPAPWPDQQ